jgi:hypothetical protein
MDEATKYKNMLEAMRKTTKKVKMEQALKSPGAKKSYAIMSKVTGVPYKGNESYEKIMKDVSKINKNTLHKTLMSGKNPYSDLVNTTNKGVSKVGEDFVKRRLSLSGAGNVLSKIPRVGKIIGAAIAGYGAAKLGEKDKKMGGGMMKKYKSGGLSPKQKKIARMAPPPDKITGDDFKAMKTMKAKSGAMVYVKTKIGKNKPTKIC